MGKVGKSLNYPNIVHCKKGGSNQKHNFSLFQRDETFICPSPRQAKY